MSETHKSVVASVTLTLEELLLIDGKVNEKAQSVIDSAKESHRIQAASGVSDSEARMVQKIIMSAREEKRLGFYFDNIKSCPCCGRNDGYWPVRRTSRYKRKGQPDYDCPKLIRGYSINPGFISIKNHISLGFCETCKDHVLPLILDALKDDRVEINATLSGVPAKFKRHRNKKCKKCGWEGHEGEMQWERCLMGDGNYPAYCPQCKTGGMFNSDVESVDGYSVVEVKPSIAASIQTEEKK